MSIRTIKLPYQCDEESKIQIQRYVENYNCILRFTYNRLFESNFKLSDKDANIVQRSMNNIFLDSWFLTSALYHARQFKGKDKVIFGGKQNFLLRCQGKISKAEFQRRRLLTLYSIGEANCKGNRKFLILSTDQVLFKPDKQHHFLLTLPKLRNNLLEDIENLIELQSDCRIAITYQLDLDNIYISFEDSKINHHEVRDKIEDRIFAVDLNPNYIGWSVVDWKNSSEYQLVDSGVISIKCINDLENKCKKSSDSPERKYLSNKRKFEIVQVAIKLSKLANHYQCQIFSLEDLEITSKYNKNGKKFNRLVNNQWNRTMLYQQIQKYCDRYQIKVQKVPAVYSSFLGNLVYRETQLPDMCLSSIETGRRSYEFFHQYIKKDAQKQSNIIFDTSEKANERIVQSLEELNFLEAFEDIKSLYYTLKTLKWNYRVPLEDSILNVVCSMESIKSKVFLYST